MYNQLKELVKWLLPKQIMFRLEPTIRSVYALVYRGDQFECNLCGSALKKFVSLPDGDKLCPACGSLPRSRRLWAIVNESFLKPRTQILDFSPSRSLYRAFKNRSDTNYTCTDISGDFISDYQYDITNLEIENHAFDLILCYHILEHIEDDGLAMKELWRVLKPGGTCLIQTPFKSGETYEDPSVISEADRLKYFGQSDHVRIYSTEGLHERLTRAGFQVEVRRFSEKADNRFGFSTQEVVMVCTKD